MTKTKLSKQAERNILQAIADQAVEDNPNLYQFTIEWRTKTGFWAVPDVARWFGDSGDYLGADLTTAKKVLEENLL
jgi:hypothetical protein